MNHLSIRLNGEVMVIETDQINLLDFLANNQFDSEKIAVAINQSFVPRSAYSQTMIQENDDIEVVSPIAGG